MHLRQYLRLPTQYPVDFGGQAMFGEGVVVNLSLGGCTIDSSCPVPLNTTLKLRIHLPDGAPIVIQEAVVQWTRQGRFGVTTMLLEPRQRDRLRRFIVTVVNKTHRGLRCLAGRRS